MLSLPITLTCPFRISPNMMGFNLDQGHQTCQHCNLQIFGPFARKLFRSGRILIIFLVYLSLSLSVHAERHREEGRVVALAGLGMAHSLKSR